MSTGEDDDVDVDFDVDDGEGDGEYSENDADATADEGDDDDGADQDDDPTDDAQDEQEAGEEEEEEDGGEQEEDPPSASDTKRSAATPSVVRFPCKTCKKPLATVICPGPGCGRERGLCCLECCKDCGSHCGTGKCANVRCNVFLPRTCACPVNTKPCARNKTRGRSCIEPDHPSGAAATAAVAGRKVAIAETKQSTTSQKTLLVLSESAAVEQALRELELDGIASKAPVAGRGRVGGGSVARSGGTATKGGAGAGAGAGPGAGGARPAHDGAAVQRSLTGHATRDDMLHVVRELSDIKKALTTGRQNTELVQRMDHCRYDNDTNECDLRSKGFRERDKCDARLARLQVEKTIYDGHVEALYLIYGYTGALPPLSMPKLHFDDKPQTIELVFTDNISDKLRSADARTKGFVDIRIDYDQLAHTFGLGSAQRKGPFHMFIQSIRILDWSNQAPVALVPVIFTKDPVSARGEGGGGRGGGETKAAAAASAATAMAGTEHKGAGRDVDHVHEWDTVTRHSKRSALLNGSDGKIAMHPVSLMMDARKHCKHLDHTLLSQALCPCVYDFVRRYGAVNMDQAWHEIEGSFGPDPSIARLDFRVRHARAPTTVAYLISRQFDMVERMLPEKYARIMDEDLREQHTFDDEVAAIDSAETDGQDALLRKMAENKAAGYPKRHAIWSAIQRMNEDVVEGGGDSKSSTLLLDKKALRHEFERLRYETDCSRYLASLIDGIGARFKVVGGSNVLRHLPASSASEVINLTVAITFRRCAVKRPSASA